MRVLSQKLALRNAADPHLRRAVYDGREMLGSIEQTGPGEYLARDRQGRPIGSYDTYLEAASAITRRAAP